MGYIGRDNRVSTFTKQSITADGGTSFTLNQGVGDSSSVMVSIGGVVQQPDVAYTAAGTSLTFTSAPTNAYPIWVIYLGKELTVASETNFDNVASQTGVGDGTTTPLTLSNSVSSVQSIIVTLNGISQVPTTDFTVSGTTLTFTTAPSSAMAILIYYIDLSLAENVVSDETVMLSSLASTGTWPAWDGSALTGVVGASDITKLHDDIALLHFLRSIDSSSKIANMIEGWSDTFPNTTSVVDGSLSVPLTRFDGTNDHLVVNPSTLGISNGKKYILSFWYEPVRDSVDENFYAQVDNTFFIGRTTTGALRVRYKSNSSTVIGDVFSPANKITVSGGKTHILVVIDTTQSNSVDRVKMRFNGGAIETLTNSTTPVLNGIIDVTTASTEFRIGAKYAGGDRVRGGLGQMYLAEEAIDISVAGNVAKFVSGTGANAKPVDMGADGSIPTGNQPRIFLNNPFGTFQTNLGSGANFTEAGQLVDGGYVSDKVYSSTNFSNSYELNSISYGKGHKNGLRSVGASGNAKSWAQTFTLSSETHITKAAISTKFGDVSPVGNYWLEIHGVTGTVGTNAVPNGIALAKTNEANAASIPSSDTVALFTFANGITLPAGDYALVVNTANLSSGWIFANHDNSPSHSGNACEMNTSYVWSSTASWDNIFYLYGSKNLTLTTKGSDSLTATSPASAPTNGYFQALIDERPASGTSIYSATLTNEGTGFDSGSYRQILPASQISTDGDKVRIRIESTGATVGFEPTGFDNIAIVERDGATPNGVRVPKEILFGGASGIMTTPKMDIWSDWTDFKIDQTKDYLLIADITTSGAADWGRYDLSGGAGVYAATGNTAAGGGTNSYNVAEYLHQTAFYTGRSFFFNNVETAVNPTINTDYIAEMSRDGGTTYSPAVLSRVTDVVAGSTDRIVQGDVSFTGDPSGTNMVGRIRTVNNNKVTVKAMGINWD